MSLLSFFEQYLAGINGYLPAHPGTFFQLAFAQVGEMRKASQ